jgi:type IV secretion system protein VirB2
MPFPSRVTEFDSECRTKTVKKGRFAASDSRLSSQLFGLSLDEDRYSGAELRHNTAQHGPLEVPMIAPSLSKVRCEIASRRWLHRIRQPVTLFLSLMLFPTLALAQSGSPFDTGFTSLQTLFTGTVAKVASLIAIVIGGYQFAHGEPGAKKALAGVAAGTGIAVLAANVLSWLWGI